MKMLFSLLIYIEVYIFFFILMEKPKKYVLGIEGSANKVGIGNTKLTKELLIFKGKSYLILEKHS
jgi:hypothetical protein